MNQQLFSSHKLMKVLDGRNHFSEYEVLDFLGAGNNAVYSVRKLNDGTELAMKEIVIRNDNELQQTRQEIHLFKKLSKQIPNLIGYHDSCILYKEQEYGRIYFGYIFMEKADTSLDKIVINFIKYFFFIQTQKKIEDYHQQNKQFSYKKILKFIYSSIEVYAQLEKYGIAHCDIKPENCLIIKQNDFQLKICDIGSCRQTNQEYSNALTIQGTVPFLAPELTCSNAQETKNNLFKTDVYSLGLCILYMITFQKFTSQERLELKELPQIFLEIVEEWMELALRKFKSTLIEKFLKFMLIPDQEKRPYFSELLNLIPNEQSATPRRNQIGMLEKPLQIPSTMTISQNITSNDYSTSDSTNSKFTLTKRPNIGGLQSQVSIRNLQKIQNNFEQTSLHQTQVSKKRSTKEIIHRTVVQTLRQTTEETEQSSVYLSQKKNLHKKQIIQVQPAVTLKKSQDELKIQLSTSFRIGIARMKLTRQMQEINLLEQPGERKTHEDKLKPQSPKIKIRGLTRDKPQTPQLNFRRHQKRTQTPKFSFREICENNLEASQTPKLKKDGFFKEKIEQSSQIHIPILSQNNALSEYSSAIQRRSVLPLNQKVSPLISRRSLQPLQQSNRTSKFLFQRSETIIQPMLEIVKKEYKPQDLYIYFEEDHIQSIIATISKEKPLIIVSDPRRIQNIFNGLQNIQSNSHPPQNICFMWRDSQEIKDEKNHLDSLVQVICTFKQNRDLQCLQLIFQNSNLECEKLVSINYQSKLKEFYIQFKECKIDGAFLQMITNGIQFDQIKVLCIHFDKCEFSSLEFQKILTLVQNMVNLEKFSFKISRQTLDSSLHRKIYDVTTKLPLLVTLSIDIDSCALPGKQIQITLNKNVEHIYLNYSYSQADQFLSSLVLSLSQVVKLKSLSLNFGQVQFQGPYLRLLIDYISKMRDLQALSINMRAQQCLDIKMVEFLTEKIKLLSNLQFTFIDLTPVKKISIKHIQQLVNQTIQSNKQLMQASFSLQRIFPQPQIRQTFQNLTDFEVHQHSMSIDIQSFTIKKISKFEELFNNNSQYSCCQSSLDGIFTCLTCNGKEQRLIKICPFCAKECHQGHQIILVEIKIFRYKQSLLNILQDCECQEDIYTCPHPKKNYCLQKTLGDKLRTVAYRCLNCSPDEESCDYYCSYCILQYHSNHQFNKLDYPITFKCKESL